MIRVSAALLLLLIGVCFGLAPAGAQAPLPEPTGKVILEVSGKIAVTNGDGVARFDLAMLDALGSEAVTTSNPWVDMAHTYEGVPAALLLERLGVTSGTVTAHALNDYSVVIPVEDLLSMGVVLATYRDGEEISVREKGPIFVVYPFDERPELRATIYYDRSVWQLTRLVVK